MIKAIFFDFYGTIVEEDDNCIRQICNDLSILSNNRVSSSEIGRLWSTEFVDLCNTSYGENFIKQSEIQVISLEKTINNLNINAEEAKTYCERLWKTESNPTIYKESISVIKKINLPIYIISNIDNKELYKAIRNIGLSVSGVITSEDAKSYKPRHEMFSMALDKYSLNVDEVIHIGDSYSSDVEGAALVGIKSIWMNRNNRNNPESRFMPHATCRNLNEILQYI